MTKKQSEINKNPFSVKTPENLTAEELVDLFVPYPEFENLQVSGHQFLNGHRGSGKSMMLRMMSPDSQLRYLNCSLSELKYFGVYLSIKATELNAPEYTRLEKEIGGTILSEHVLTTKLLSTLFSTINEHCIEHIGSENLVSELQRVISLTLFNKLKYAGWREQLPDNLMLDTKDILSFAINLVDEIHNKSVQYIKRRSFLGAAHPYEGALLGFQDVLLPIVKELSDRNILPKKAPVYFLLDDADNLTEQQTQILNTWVSYRTTGCVSLKISTQLNYKTQKTVSGIKIEEPHDFSSINFTSVHTGSVKERYPKLVADIVKKRLNRYGIENVDPLIFFPEDEAQKRAIQDIANEIKDEWMPGKSGYRPADDSYRFARAEYIRRLSGSSKQGSNYRYAGFEQLVHISSGIIRFFLEPAARMFTEQLLKNGTSHVDSISVAVQDKALREQSDQLLLHDFETLVEDTDSDEQLNDITRLRNIVQGIGSLFKAHVMSKTSKQRRVFSFSISDTPSRDITKILKLGVVHGYFYVDSIGTKDGMGRTVLYVLTRRLAPSFSLDPIGFSNYLTVTNEFLIGISEKPQTYIRRIREKKDIDSFFDDFGQLSLLEGYNHE